MIKLTDADSGLDIYINPEYLESLVEDRGDHGTYNSVVTMRSGAKYSVRQKVNEIRTEIMKVTAK